MFASTDCATPPLPPRTRALQITHEEFLEDVNCLLNAGEIPNMYTSEETDAIAEDMRQALTAEAADSPPTRSECDAAFLNRVRRHLHVVLCFSPVGGRLQKRCRTFPALVNNCTIDWFRPWPATALHSVALRYLGQLSDLLSDTQMHAIASACTYVQQTMEEMCVRYLRELRRHMYVTPKSYLNLVGTYMALLTAKRGEMSFSRQRCMTGVTKIEDSNALVGRLKVRVCGEWVVCVVCVLRVSCVSCVRHVCRVCCVSATSSENAKRFACVDADAARYRRS